MKKTTGSSRWISMLLALIFLVGVLPIPSTADTDTGEAVSSGETAGEGDVITDTNVGDGVSDPDPSVLQPADGTGDVGGGNDDSGTGDSGSTGDDAGQDPVVSSGDLSSGTAGEGNGDGTAGAANGAGDGAANEAGDGAANEAGDGTGSGTGSGVNDADPDADPAPSLGEGTGDGTVGAPADGTTNDPETPADTEGGEDEADPEGEPPVETTLKIGENEFVVTLGGDYSDRAASIRVPDESEDEKAAMEEAMGASAEQFRIVELRDAYNNPVTLGQDWAAYEDEIPVTVSGSWLLEYAQPVFALMNADGTAQIVSAQRGTLDDGSTCYRFRADALSSLMIAIAGTPVTAASDAGVTAEPEDPETAVTEEPAPALRAVRGDEPAMDVTVNINWSGNEPSDHSSRPNAVFVTMKRSVDGTTWEDYSEMVPFIITAGDNGVYTNTFTLPARDEQGRAYTYQITESNEGLSRYLVPTDPQTTGAGTNSTVSFTNTYNDGWDYHLEMYWDVTDPTEKIFQDIHTTSRSTDEAKLVLSITSQKPYPPCDDPLNPTQGLVVRIPRSLLEDRYGNPIYPTQIGLHDDTNIDEYYRFTYTIDPDNGDLVFYNWTDFGTDNINIEIQYKIKPMDVLDCTVGSLQAHGEGHYTGQPATDDGLQDSNAIYYRMDTGARFTNFSKDDGYPLYYVPSSLSAYENDFDFENYRYVVYILRYTVEGNQPIYNLQFTDEPHQADGENGKVVAILQPDEKYTASGSGSNQVLTYTRPASSLSLPAGSPVAFIESTEDHHVEWTTSLNMLRKSSSGNYVNYGEMCFYLVVRYDIVKVNGYVVEDMIYHNDEFTGALEVRDPQHEDDIRDPESGGENSNGGNDYYDTDDANDDAVAFWVPYVDPGSGGSGIWNASKKITGVSSAGFTRLQHGASYQYYAQTTFNVNGENIDTDGVYYYGDWRDDDVYVRGYYDDGTGNGAQWHEYIKLGPGDFEIYETSDSTFVDTYAYTTDPATGEHIPVQDPFTVQVLTTEGNWILYNTFTMGANGHFKYTPSHNYISGKGYCGIRVLTPQGLRCHLEMTIRVYYRILGTSPVIRHLIDDLHATDITIVNHSTNDLYMSDPVSDPANAVYHLANPATTYNELVEATGLYSDPGEQYALTEAGTYHQYRSSAIVPSKHSKGSGIKKALAATENHQESHSFSHQWYISAYETINTTVFTNAEIQEMNYSADTGVFYDLLPPGYHLDQTRPIEVAGYTGDGKINGNYPASLTSVTVQPNFRDTGRDLVTFQVQSLLDPHLNIWRNNYTYTGFTVKFWTVVSYFDVDENPVWNICEYRRGDEKAMSGSAYDDNRGYSTAANAPHYQVNGIYPLTNLDGDGVAESKTALYYSVSVRPTYIGATQNGLHKYVKGNSGLWSTQDVTDLEGTYSYRIQMESSDGGTTSNVVLYDVLEDAMNTSGATGEGTGWRGTLQSVDVSQAVAMGIDPVVYYTTEHVSYNDQDSQVTWEHSLQREPGIWSTTMPADPSTITAVAIDLRWSDAEAQTPFEFKGAKIVSVILNMLAPDSLQSWPYAYNRPAYDSTTLIDGAPNATQEFSIAQRTIIELRDLQDLEFFKYYETIDADGNAVQQGLGGATFQLYQCTSNEAGHVHTGMPGTDGSCWGTTPFRTVISMSDGIVSFTGLDTGEYAVIESAIPTRPVGLEMLTNRWWTFTVNSQTGTLTAPEAHSTDETAYPLVEMEWDESTGTGRYTLRNDLPNFDISVEKLWEGTVPVGGTLTFDLYIGDSETPYRTRTVTIPAGTTSPWTITNLFVGLPRVNTAGDPIQYRLAERNNAGFAITSPVDGSVTFTAPETGNYSTSFTNSRLGWLEIEKILTAGDPEAIFTFTVSLKVNGTPVADDTVYHFYRFTASDTGRENPIEESVTASGGAVTVYLMAGQMIRFYDLAVGTEYTITESPAAGYHLVSKTGDTGTTTDTTVPHAEFTNTESVGSLQISKTVTSGDTTKAFTVNVILTKNGQPVTGEYPLTVTGASGTTPTAITFMNGTASFQIHSGETWLIGNLPNGAVYTVSETGLTTGWRLETSADGLTGDIVYDETMTVALVNSYTPAPTTVEIPVEKQITGQTPSSDTSFTFILTPENEDNPMPASNTVTVTGAATGKFGAIEYTEAGVYTYTVTERNDGAIGYNYSDVEHTVVVTVTDDGNGQLSAGYVIDGNEDTVYAVFDNPYTPVPTEYPIPVKKILTGPVPKDKEMTFEFTLAGPASDNIEMPTDLSIEITVKSDGSGNVTNGGSFDAIRFLAAGTYEFTVTEVKPNPPIPGVTYPTNPTIVTITVTDVNGNLTVTNVTGLTGEGTNAAVEITNVYGPAPAKIQIPVQKVISGQTPSSDTTFTFILTPENEDTPMPASNTVTVTGAATGKFGEIEYEETGTYTYTVTERNDGAIGYNYSDVEHTVVVTVSDSGNDGKLTASYVIDGNEDTVYAVFNNPYTPVPTELSIPVKKTVQGEPEADAVFTFTLSAADGVPMPDQPVVTITGAGTADIGPIEYTEAGTYTYTLQETDGAVPGFTYDTTPRTITVTVTDDHGRLSAVWAGSDPTAEYVEFINPYEPPHIALTVEKIWDDANDQDRIRPESITVTLHAEYTKDGVTSEVTLPAGIQTTVTITEADGWTYTWDALPKYKDLIYEIAYTVEEAVIAVPPGFNASYTPSYSDITYDSERGVYVIEITNPHVPETIDFDFTKVGEPLEAGEEAVPVALDGITFSLFTDEECTTPAMGTAADGSTFPLTAVSDADGVVTFQNLRYGVYYMKETDQGDHDEAYWDNNAVYTVTAAATGVTIEVNEADVEYTGALISDDVIENSLVRYEIEILKLDGKALRDDPDNEVPVEGAEFALYGADYLIENEDGDMEADPNAVPILTGITTDEEGKASLGSLTVGTYYLVETHAPVEYLLLEEPVEITVAEGEITVGEDVYHEEGDDPHRIVIRLTNEPKYGNLEIVKYLPTYEVDEPATFVFDVVATMGVDENGDPIVVYSNVAVLTFTKAGTLSTTLYHIPAGAEVVVTEVYSGSHYELTSAAESTVTIVASETVSVYFENDYIPYDRDGHGIVNVFDPDDSAAGWHWTPASSN